MSESVLHKIAWSVRTDLEERKNKVSFERLTSLAHAARTPHPFYDDFKNPAMHVIAEVKFRSPALGQPFLENANAETAVKIASAYYRAGATAISILTEKDHFFGSLTYLQEVRKALPDTRLLMKDFILEEYQILEGRVKGADAILLIMALLGKDQTKKLLQFTHQLGLSALVEVHDEAELDHALSIHAPLIGINNRNLKTLNVSLNHSFELIKKLSESQREKTILISESGIRTAEEIKKLHAAGFSGFLMGSTFMATDNPGEALKKLLGEVKGKKPA